VGIIPRSLVFSILLLTTILVKAAPMEDFYPLQSGDQYSFSNTFNGVSSLVVKSSSRISGAKAVGNNVHPASQETRHYFSNGSQGLRLHGVDLPQVGQFNFSPPVVIAPANPVPSSSTVFQNGSVSGTALCGQARDIPTSINISYTASHRVISEQSNQVIRNKTYPETLTVKSTVSVSGGVPSICGGFFSQQISNETNTYARYLGPVKSVVSIPGFSETFELVGTNIGIVQLVTDAVTVDEDAGTASVGVRKFGTFVGEVSVQCFSDPAGASATAADDYTELNTLVVFPNGNDFGVLPCSVPIIDDNTVEEDEIFGISISNITSILGDSVRIAGIEDAVVTITDNDVAPTSPNPSHDLTGDGKSDVLVRNSNTNAWFAYVMNGRAVTSQGSIPMTGNGLWQTAGVSDYTGDGKSDVLIRNSSSNAWYLNELDGRSITARGSVSMTGNGNWAYVGSGDFTGDGKSDVLIRHNGTNAWYLYELDGRAVVSRGGIRMTGNANWQPVAVTDFTGDGKVDVLIRNTVTGAWYLNELEGRTITGRGSVPMTNNKNWEFVGSGDFTGDGKSDVLIRHNSTNAWYLYELDGRTVVSRGGIRMTGNANWQPQQVEDFTGDGKVDVLIRNTVTGAWYLNELDGRTITGRGGVILTGNQSWENQ